MTIQEQIINDLKTIENDLGNQLMTYKGYDYIVIPTSNSETLALDDNYNQSGTITIKVRKNQFTDGVIPVEKDHILYRNKTYKINSIVDDAFDTYYKYVCTLA